MTPTSPTPADRPDWARDDLPWNETNPEWWQANVTYRMGFGDGSAWRWLVNEWAARQPAPEPTAALRKCLNCGGLGYWVADPGEAVDCGICGGSGEQEPTPSAAPDPVKFQMAEWPDQDFVLAEDYERLRTAVGHTITPECGPICWTTGHHHDPEACDGCRRLADAMHAAGLALTPAEPRPAPAGLDVVDLGLSAEQTIVLRDLLGSRQQTVSEWLGDCLMDWGLGRVAGRDYPPAMQAYQRAQGREPDDFAEYADEGQP
jgi:hypothetical protein